LKNPVPPEGPKANKRVVTVWHPGRASSRINNKIVCLNQNMCCYSHYQVQGAHAHLNQKINKDLDETVSAATAIKYYDDPLHLEIPYQFFMEMLPEPPDGLTKSILSLTLIIFVYLYPVFKALTKYYLKLIGSYTILSEDKNVFIQCGQHRRKRRKLLPHLHIKMYTADTNPNDELSHGIRMAYHS
jgi:hypothetical protein